MRPVDAAADDSAVHDIDPEAGRHGRRSMLRDLARERFGVDLAGLHPVVGGLDERARVWQGVGTDGSLWSLKSTRRDCRFGLALSASITEAGVDGVVGPRRARDGLPWAEARGSLVSLAPWIAGDDAVTAGPDSLSWEALGDTLRAIHSHPVPTTAVPVRRGIRRSGLPMQMLLDDVDARLGQLAARTSADEVEHSRRVEQAWTAARGRLTALARAERALKRHRTSVDRVPLHGDPHLGNVVVTADARPWLIDFDESTVAPREVDLMLVELGVIFSAPVTDRQRASFRSGYGSLAVDDSRIARFGCVRAIEDATATVLRLADSRPDERDGLASFLSGQLGPDGLVTLAEHALLRLDDRQALPHGALAAAPLPRPIDHPHTAHSRGHQR
ncbi:MAG: phosphotransferase [Naasia sp.]